MNSSKYFLVMMIGLFLTLPAEAGLFGPKNYEECIRESMKGVTSDVAARAIMRACRKQFPEKAATLPQVMVLANNQLSEITGQMDINLNVGRDYFTGAIYNGNNDITVTEITVNVATTINREEVQRLYKASVNIPPLTTLSHLGITIIPGDIGAKYFWSIVEAKGYKAN